MGSKWAEHYVGRLHPMHTINWDIFMLKIFHTIIFYVKIFLYASRPYETILPMKNFQQAQRGLCIIANMYARWQYSRLD